jgi:hypothetical protein
LRVQGHRHDCTGCILAVLGLKHGEDREKTGHISNDQ